MRRRIAITGLGVLSPVGSGKEKFWEHIVKGQIGTTKEPQFDLSPFDLRNAGEVTDLNPRDFFKTLNPDDVGRTTQLAVAAAWMAADDADFASGVYRRDRVGVCFGTTMGNADVIERFQDVYGSPEEPSALISRYPEGYIAAAVAEELDCEGPCMTIPTACAAGNYAISWGSDLIRNGVVDAVVVGGSDALSRACYSIFYRLGAITTDLCQPFDKDRQGIVVSEGAASLILEDYEMAVQRGARIYAELLGYGLSCDAHHPTAPHPQGLGAVLAMERALSDASLDPQHVTYISAHGTGTKANDLTESIAIRSVFQDRADQVYVNSIKSMLGHTMGAASAIEAVMCTLSVHNGMIPPTMNYREPDPECVPSVVPNEPVGKNVEHVVSNSFAFGGNISIIVIGGHHAS